ncbi:AhpC/TSA family protein [Alteribacillus iranensis]|uniref:AhpC/TSA family protein n=2 Tax=Alteribacillus iranensis TaxID=930128 RepID=A0A1I2E1H5_9BACI|nr:AhpC/TSA family protein [Alteribacillus iranensis]
MITFYRNEGTYIEKQGKEQIKLSLEIGEMAPDFTLPSTNKQDITLSDFRGNKNVLIMFYPLNFTPV